MSYVSINTDSVHAIFLLIFTHISESLFPLCKANLYKMLPHKDLTKCPRELSVLSTLMYVLCTQHVLECLMCNLHCFLKICVWRIPLLNYRHFEFNCDLCFLRQLYVVTWKTTVDSSPTSTPET